MDGFQRQQLPSFVPTNPVGVVEADESDGHLADTEDSDDRFSVQVDEPTRSGSDMSQVGGDGDEATDSSGIDVSSSSDSLVILASESPNTIIGTTSSHTTNLSIPMSEKSKTMICGKYEILGFTLKPRAAPGHRYVVSLDEVISRRHYEMKLPTWVPTYAQRINCILNNFLSHFTPEEEKVKDDDGVQIIHPTSSRNWTAAGRSQEISEEEVGQSIRLLRYPKSCLKLTPNITIGESKPKNIQWSQRVDSNEDENANKQAESIVEYKNCSADTSQSTTSNNSARKVHSCPGIFVLEEGLIKLDLLTKPALTEKSNETSEKKSLKERLKEFFRIKNCRCLTCLRNAKKKPEPVTVLNILSSKCDENINQILSSTSLDPDTSRDESGAGSDPISPTELKNDINWATLSLEKKSLPALPSKDANLTKQN